MATIAELRAGLGSDADQYTDEQLYNAYKTVAGPRYRDEKTFQKAVGWDPEWDFGRSMRIAGRNTLAAGAGVGAMAADMFGLTGARDAALAYGQDQQKRASWLGRRSDDVDNFTDDPLSFLSSAAGQGVAYAVPSLVGGGLGALGARAAGMGALRGAAAGSFATNLGQESGGIYNELAEQGRYEPGRALAFGLPAAALDTASEAIPFLGAAGKGGLMRRIAGGFTKQAGVEAGTETAQTAIERAGAYKDVTGPEAWHEYRNAAAVGAVGGGMFGGAMGLMPAKRPPAPVNDAPGQPTDLLQVQQGFDARRPDLLAGFNPVGRGPDSRVLQPTGEPTPEWGLSRGARDTVQPYPSVGDPTDLFRMPNDGRLDLVRGFDPRLNGLFTGPMQPGIRPTDTFSAPTTDTRVPPLSPPMAVDPLGAAGGPLYVNRPGGTPTNAQSPDIARMEGGEQLSLGSEQDLGFALARERYLEQARQAEEQKARIKAAEERHAANRAAAVDTLIEKNPDGSLPIKLQPREHETFTMLSELKAAGALDDAGFEDRIGRMRDALKNGDNPGLRILNRDARALKERANAAGTGTDGRAGTADVGGSAGNQRAPAQPGGVQPAAPGAAAQAVDGANAVAVGSPGNGGGAALTPSAPVLGTKAADAPARVAQVLGRELTLEQKAKAQKLANASPKARGYVQDLLGVDAEWHQVNSPMTLDEVAKKYGSSRQNISQVLGRLGITEEQLNAARATNLQSVSTEELGLTQTDRAEGAADQATGFRVSDKAGAGADDFQLDARTVRQQRETDAFLKANDTGSVAVVDEAKAAREAETDRRNKERAVRGLIAWLDDPRNADNVRASGIDWDDAKSDNHPSYNQLPMHVRALWARDYLAQIEETGNDWDPIQQAFDEFVTERADQLAAAQDSVADTGAGQQRIAGPAEPAGAGVRPGDEDVDWGEQAAQMSRDTERDGETTYHTAESLEDSLLSFMNEDALGKRVVIVETGEDLKHEGDRWLASYDNTAVAWARDGRAYLIADRIPVGNERGVFMHEVGGHLGLERLLGEKEYSRLVGKLVGWAARNDQSQESVLARKAKDRVNKAGTEGAEARNAELVAYFLEEAVNAGINPTALRYDSAIMRDFLRPLWAAFKVALRRLGVNIDKLTAQDVVNLGYGAARITITGRFHGTAADVQQFRTKYVGTGEGAQAYGWGLYFSELRGVAEDYKKSDVQRKGGNWGTGKSFQQYPDWTALKQAAKADDFLGFEDIGTMLSDYIFDVRKGRAKTWVTSYDMSPGLKKLMSDFAVWYETPAKPIKGNLYATDIAVKPDEFLDWTKPLDEQSATVKKALRDKGIGRDVAAQDDGNAWARIVNSEMPEELRPKLRAIALIHQKRQHAGESITRAGVAASRYPGDTEIAAAVQDVEARLAKRAEDEIVLPPGYEKTGGGLYRYLQSNEIEDIGPSDMSATQIETEAAKRVSQWLDSIGVKGVRMPVNYTSGGTYDSGQNFVVFNEKNVIKALDNPASRVSKSVQFSRENDPVGRDEAFRRLYNKAREAYSETDSPDDAYDALYEDASPNEQRFLRALKKDDFLGFDYPHQAMREVQLMMRNDEYAGDFDISPALKAAASFLGNRTIQYSKMVKPEAAAQLTQVSAAVTESLSPKAKGAWTDVRDFFKKNTPYLLTNFQIAEQWGAKIASLKAYVKVADLMRMETVKQQMAFDAIATRWDSLPKAARSALDEITQRATLREMHPDLPFDHKDNGHLKGRDGAQAEHAALAAKYKQMANAHPAAAKVYQEAKAALEASRQRMVDASNQLYADYGIKKTVPNEVAGPYFPLMRFGEYLAIGESAAYKALADEVAQTPPGDARKELDKRLDAMKRDPKHYVVSAHESRSAMERARDQYAKQGLDARVAMADQRLNALPKDVHTMVSQLATQMANKFDGATATAFIDEYKTLLVKALPELHALNRAAERKGVEGASPDMLRAFAAAGRQNAFYTARLMYAKDSAQAMQDMKGEVKGDTDLTHVHREMEKRAALDLQFKDTPFQDLAGTAAWVYYLGASPTFLFMNMTQPWLVTGPVLAGKYGAAKATKALGQASREALQVLRDARWKDGKWSPWEGISESSVATTRKNAEGVSEDRKALRELMQRGIVDEGLQHEMRTFAEGGNRTLAKFGRWTGWASQQIELVNRTATALAAFRLARGQGLDYDAAVNEAYRVTTNTQMDYSAEGTARFMREGGGIPLAKLLFQFRRYQQTMLYVLGDNIKKLANPAERAVAAKSLAYFAMTSGLAAGAMGLPFAGTMMMLANAFMDDDDDRGDAKTRLRNLLFDLTGDRGMADVLAKGIPAAFGADLSARIGLGDIAQLYPRLELNGKTGEENVGKLAASVLGPSAGLATQFFQAGIHFSNGDFAKGTEKMAPKMLADVLRAGRYNAQGMTDGKGETILGSEEISAWDKLLRAAGTTAINESNYYEGTKAKRDIQTAVTERKTQIHREFRRAIRSGDFEDVRAMIQEFNADHPAERIKPKDEIAWRREARKSASQRDETGIQFNPKRDAAVGEVMRFARGS